MKAIQVFALTCLAGIVSAGVYTDRFNVQYNKIKNKKNGYFSPGGVPYHAVETLIVDGPDHGHETTSEDFSYWIWLEAVNGKINSDWKPFNDAWDILEQNIIPGFEDQPTADFYFADNPNNFVAVKDQPSEYPALLDTSVPVGQDPLQLEFDQAYATSDTYGMHRLLDVDNVYGFGNTYNGNCEGGPNATGPSFIDTYRRGPMESAWKTIPQPTCDSFRYGGPNGFLDLYVEDKEYVGQWRFTNAPEADARAVQAAYWALKWAPDSGQLETITNTLSKASKMGDFLRYSLYDKYFKQIGDCVSLGCPGSRGKSSAHYLLGWSYAWGGTISASGAKAWRTGASAAHVGHQNPLAAFALFTEDLLQPRAFSGVSDWRESVDRQVEFYQWLQTAEGAFAGGATNSWNGRYDAPPAEVTANTFHGMFYDWQPEHHDPPSNRWYGMQARSADRLAQYYYVSEDDKAKAVLDKWVAWVLANIEIVPGSNYTLPEELEWSGVPPNVHVNVTKTSSDVGTGAATARALAFYAARSNNQRAKQVAKEILDIMWTAYQTDKGVSVPETSDSYRGFDEEVDVPSGWTGRYPNGDVIQAGATFLSIRSWYKNDTAWPAVEQYLKGGPAPTFTYHRFWAQADIAIAQGTYGILFNE